MFSDVMLACTYGELTHGMAFAKYASHSGVGLHREASSAEELTTLHKHWWKYFSIAIYGRIDDLHAPPHVVYNYHQEFNFPSLATNKKDTSLNGIMPSTSKHVWMSSDRM